MKKKDKEKEPFDPDIHGGGIENFASYPTPLKVEKEKKDENICNSNSDVVGKSPGKTD